jgi:hypothetical protein
MGVGGCEARQGEEDGEGEEGTRGEDGGGRLASPETSMTRAHCLMMTTASPFVVCLRFEASEVVHFAME